MKEKHQSRNYKDWEAKRPLAVKGITGVINWGYNPFVLHCWYCRKNIGYKDSERVLVAKRAPWALYCLPNCEREGCHDFIWFCGPCAVEFLMQHDSATLANEQMVEVI